MIHLHRWIETEYRDGPFPGTFVYLRRCACGATEVGAAFKLAGLWGDSCPTVRRDPVAEAAA